VGQPAAGNRVTPR